MPASIRKKPALPDMTELEKLAVKHEDFGFGVVDGRGFSTHGFNPKGLTKFVKEVIKHRDEQWAEMLKSMVKRKPARIQAKKKA